MAKKTSTSEKKVRQIRRKSRKQYSGEEKIRIGMCQQILDNEIRNLGKCRWVVSAIPATGNHGPVLGGVKGFASRPTAADP